MSHTEIEGLEPEWYNPSIKGYIPLPLQPSLFIGFLCNYRTALSLSLRMTVSAPEVNRVRFQTREKVKEGKVKYLPRQLQPWMEVIQLRGLHYCLNDHFIKVLYLLDLSMKARRSHRDATAVATAVATVVAVSSYSVCE